MERLVVPQGDFALRRYPVRPREQFRAWDAADELLLRHVAEHPVTGPLLVVNDSFGALATALAELRPQSLSDSYVARRSAEQNLSGNGIEPATIDFLGSFDPPADELGTVLCKLPKSLALLEDQLRRLRPHLRAGTTVVAAGMAKHVHTSTLELFGRVLGPTTTSRAEKKARLAFVAVDPALDPGPDPWPATFTVQPGGLVVTAHANAFSPDRLDSGTRFLLDHLPTVGGPEHVVDLGCGTGVVGTVVAQANPEAVLTFVDESAMAVASAEATFQANLGADREARFVLGDGIADLASGPPIGPGTVDRVVVNPPFHVDHAITDAVAWQMFSEARAALRPGGELWVVGNRHLAYHAKLKRLFGNATVAASNAKFVVLRAGR